MTQYEQTEMSAENTMFNGSAPPMMMVGSAPPMGQDYLGMAQTIQQPQQPSPWGMSQSVQTVRRCSFTQTVGFVPVVRNRMVMVPPRTQTFTYVPTVRNIVTVPVPAMTVPVPAVYYCAPTYAYHAGFHAGYVTHNTMMMQQHPVMHETIGVAC